MSACTCRWCATGCVLVFVVVLAGCGRRIPTARVSGTVTYEGVPVTVGSVSFVSKTGAAAIAAIDPSGRYTVDGDMEVGEFAVYVVPPLPEPGKPVPKSVLDSFRVPQKFQDPSYSGISATIKPGKNSILVDLKE